MAPQGKKRRQRRKGKGPRQVTYPERQINVAVGPHIPPRDFLGTRLGGIEQSIRRTLTWTAFSMTSVTNTYNDFQQVLMNSPYDPDAALGGLSAQGYSKYIAFYTKCFTLGARLKFKGCISGTGGAGVPPAGAIVGMTVTTLPAVFSSLVNALQNGLCDYKVLNQHPDSFELMVAVDIAKYVDKPDLLDDPQFYCTSSTNPAQQIVAHVWADCIQTTGTVVVTGILEMEMDCVFTDPQAFT